MSKINKRPSISRATREYVRALRAERERAERDAAQPACTCYCPPGSKVIIHKNACPLH